MRANRNSTQSAAFVFVVDERKPKMEPRRLRFPRSLEILKMKAKEILQLDDPVLSFFNRNGKKVNTIEDVCPGDVLLASTKIEYPPIDDLSEIQQSNTEEEYNEEDEGEEEEYIIHNTKVMKTELKESSEPLDSDILKSDSLHSDQSVVLSSTDTENLEEEDNSSKEEEDDLKEEKTTEKTDSEKIFGRASLNSEALQIIQNQLEKNPKQLKFVRKQLQNEEEQAKISYQATIQKLPGSPALTNGLVLAMRNEIDAKISRTINEHRTVVPECVAYSFKTIIAGPPKSGKSTFLALLSRQLLADMRATRSNKRNFVFAFDGSQMALNFGSISEFMKAYIDLIFDAISNQRIGAAKYKKSLSNYFYNLHNGHKPPQPPAGFIKDENFRATAASLYQIAEQVASGIDDMENDDEWSSRILSLPILISSAFGFQRTHFLIDNVEFLDAIIQIGRNKMEVFQAFSKALEYASFIVAVKDSPLENLPFRKDSQIVSTLGFKGEFYGDNREFSVRFDGEPRAVRVTPRVCGGCPAYLALWEEMCMAADEDDEELAVADAKEQMQALIAIIFPGGPATRPIREINITTVVA